MILLATALFAGILAFGTTTYAKEESTTAISTISAATNTKDSQGPGKGEIKEVCVDKTDKAGKVINGKDGKPVQVCKKIKVRKKLEGTKIEDAKKK